ncbi:MAG: peptide ABC transporter substrate-binding protein [Candidatus Hydrogenedentota bacterium]|nr:MAG: peptide ABC transporter substrate-binding protein [Candidatus Hydrogenedentota bacterium]
MQKAWLFLFGVILAFFSGCFSNNPYPEKERGKNIYYDTFSEEPKHLDPALSYSSSEYVFLAQIYEPLLEYHFLKRPYTLQPLAARKMPQVFLYDARGNLLPPRAPASAVKKVVYRIEIKKGMKYVPHPAFARDNQKYVYHLGVGGKFPDIENPIDFPKKGTREVTADDFIYEIKRMANPLLPCPIYPVLAKYLDGFAEFSRNLAQVIQTIREVRKQNGGPFFNEEAYERKNPIYIDLRKYKMRGLKKINRYTLEITLKQKYPQFIYWLAMPFFSPVPWEADRFYRQPAAAEKNFTLDRFPIGSGPYYLAVNQPNYRMVLKKNPDYEGLYPTEGMPEDKINGFLEDAGKKIPFIDTAVFVLEKESIPRWTKFLQGYYDTSAISSDVFDSALQFSAGEFRLSDELKAKGIQLLTSASPSTYYFAFNMLDDVVGGNSDRARYLRQAISIAVDIEEYIEIFLNMRAKPAYSPIPPGIFGSTRTPNPIVYDANGQRKPISVAKKLMKKAGYPDGVNPATGKHLVLFFDSVAAGGAENKARYDWLRKQFKKIGIELQIRETDYNQFRDKVLKGNFQLIQWGWHADYPDPENFLFLLYGPNSKVKARGENAANYDNPLYNQLFREMESLSDSPRRKAIIERMIRILQQDAPWIFGFHPIGYALVHEWYKNGKPMAIGSNTLKYKRIDPALREKKRKEWNVPNPWPVYITLILVFGFSAYLFRKKLAQE